MKTQKLLKQNNDPICLMSPGVGFFSPEMTDGALADANQIVGVLKCLNQRIQLRMPEGETGRLHWAHPNACRQPVAYGEVLATLTPWAASETKGAKSKQKSKNQSTFDAPMEGLFYTKPEPAAAPFVKTGQTLNKGDQVGLIEVMKTFYPITYEGDTPQKVTAIKVKNAQPVDIGTPLFLFV